MLEFTWDEQKNVTNFKKHGVWFEEAQSAFDDPKGKLIPDPDHSTPEEDCWILLGFTSQGKLLVVVHVELEENKLVRIVSARKAQKDEAEQYGEGI